VAVSSDWYARQFGDRDDFAVTISLGRDPHPTGDAQAEAGWGGLALWARGRCLTRNVADDGGTCDEVRWTLGSIFEWLAEVGPRLVNEEPLPLAPSDSRVRDASDWFDLTESPFPARTEPEETEWFLQRSEWRRHHALRRAAQDVALPNVVMRRLGDQLEVSWDNETWGLPRADLRFVEQRGRELVSAKAAAAALRDALGDATAALAARYDDLGGLRQLAEAAVASVARAGDWRWLVHGDTAQVIRHSLPLLAEQLEQHAAAQRDGWYLPHTAATLALRQSRLSSGPEVERFLAVALQAPQEPMSDTLRALVKPSPAPAVRPWLEGYELAADVREALGWGYEPLPELTAWLQDHRIDAACTELAGSVALVVTRTPELAAATTLNPRADSRLRREIGHAAALGHLLFDPSAVAVEGAWEHWPTAARARAFGVMLLLPSDGMRDILRGKTAIFADDVARVMARFGTGPYATTYHLKNHGLIDDERRTEILRELAA